MPDTHTDKQYESELNHIRESFAEMAQMVMKMLKKSLEALFSSDSNLAYQVVKGDDEIDRREIEINELCVSVIARRQPLGPDLRFLMSVQKSITDLERVADLCVSISERTIELNQIVLMKDNPNLELMAAAVREMLHCTIEAFLSKNIKEAREVILKDRTIDAYYAQLFRQLLEMMSSGSKMISQGSRILSVIGSLERIGDHAKNICEHILYMCTGREVAHKTHQKAADKGIPRGVLFLCVHNSARSQMAEGWAKKILPQQIMIYSAGSLPAKEVNPLAAAAMKEAGIDIKGQHPKRLTNIPLGKVDMVITLCSEEVCVNLPDDVKRKTWFFPDPAAEANDRARVAAFKQVRDAIKEKIEELASEFNRP